ncbi:cytochrome P450 [Rhizoctonia solani]|nr:cytochrome P450 [Rhizoctonia solani]
MSSITTITSPAVASWLAIGGLVFLTVHWLRRPTILVNLPGPPGGNWLYGHFINFMGVKGLDYQEKLFSTYGPTTVIKGFLGTDLICTTDPAVIHTVQIKEKDKFPRAQGPAIMLRAVFGGGLLALPPDERRMQRKLLNPVFNMKFLRECSGRMPIFMSIAKETTTAINKDLASSEGSKEVDVFPWATAAALDLVGEAGLGYAFNSFSGERNEYSTAIKGVTQSFGKIGPFVQILPYVYRLGTPAFRRWVMNLIPSSTLQHLRRVVSLQNGQAEEVLRSREAALSAGNDLSAEAGRGRDIMTLLMKANESAGSESYIDRETLIGHMNVFIFAGHETTSTAVSRILDVLAQRPDIQVRLREELRQYFEANPDETHHDALLELPYLDGIVREALRLHPPVAVISRICDEDTVLPLDFPVDTPSGKITGIPIKRGARIVMSNAFFNRNKSIWGERADEFLPERWIGSKLDEVTQPGSRLPGVYSSMMTFGSGSYACIGFKFAVMEIKVMLAELITNFKFEPSKVETTWVNHGVQFPYPSKEVDNSEKFPKLFLKVTKI